MAGGEATPADREALTAWLLAFPRHAEAYAKVEGLKARGKALARRLSRRDVAKGTGAGAGAIVVAFSGWRYLETHSFADFRTAKGERRTIRLADGSTVELAAETRLAVALGPSERKLTLHDGEAFFQVAPLSAGHSSSLRLPARSGRAAWRSA